MNSVYIEQLNVVFVKFTVYSSSKGAWRVAGEYWVSPTQFVVLKKEITPQVERKRLREESKGTQVQCTLLHDLCTTWQCLPTALSGFTIKTSILWLLYILCKYMFENCKPFSFHLVCGFCLAENTLPCIKNHGTEIDKKKLGVSLYNWRK